MLYRLQRTWQLGRLAARARGMRRLSPTAKRRARSDMATDLRDLHGLPHKLSQLLALGELDPDAPGHDFYRVSMDGGRAMPFEQVMGLLEERLGVPLSQVFSSIAPEGVAASLNQVHEATLRDGRRVAVKLRYPGVAADIFADLGTLKWMAAPAGVFKRGFSHAAYHRELSERLTDELDLRRELNELEFFGAATSELPYVEVPTPVRELSNDGVLVMSWLTGEDIARVVGWPEADREQVARTLVEVFLWSCFRWRTLHADPHPGNYRFRREAHGPVVAMLDFGCTRVLSSATASALAELIADVAYARQRTAADYLERYAALGFNVDLLVPMADKLPALSRLLFEPFSIDAPYDVRQWNLGPRAAALLGESRWSFRFAGPASLIYFMRACHGLLAYQRALRAQVPWRALFLEATAPLGLDAKTKRVGPRETSASGAEQVVRSRHLRVQVRDGERVKVDLTFRAAAAASLADLVPDDLGGALDEQGIDLHAMAADVVASDFAPRTLFELAAEQKKVRVWLE